MRIRQFDPLLAVVASAAGYAILFATTGPEMDLDWINRLDVIVQHRFEDPRPANLGMSRIAYPRSFGEHFLPDVTHLRDFNPERSDEKDVIAELERRKLQVGFYLLGAAIGESPAESLDYRALKGPAAMTVATPRPVWYPSPSSAGQAVLIEQGGVLPNWHTIYPVAQKALRSFQDGGRGFETRVDQWNVAARPVLATSDRCIACHNGPPTNVNKRGDIVGGVLYAYRHQ